MRLLTVIDFAGTPLDPSDDQFVSQEPRQRERREATARHQLLRQLPHAASSAATYATRDAAAGTQ